MFLCNTESEGKREQNQVSEGRKGGSPEAFQYRTVPNQHSGRSRRLYGALHHPRGNRRLRKDRGNVCSCFLPHGQLGVREIAGAARLVVFGRFLDAQPDSAASEAAGRRFGRAHSQTAALYESKLHPYGTFVALF